MKAGSSVLSVRRPVDPAAAEAFLSGKSYPVPTEVPALAIPGEAASAVPAMSEAPAMASVAGAPSHGRKVHERKDGRRVRRTTILMREELAHRLDVFAAHHGIDKTAVHEAALEAWLVTRDR